MSIEKKPICVVIDTNIWMQDSNLLLKTVMGSALLYILRQSKGKIGLPEIIEEELTRNIVEKGIQAGKLIEKNFQTIEIVMGSRCPYELPNQEQLEKTVKGRLEELKDLIVRVPFTFDHAKGALRRINEKSAPNEDGEKFKDSAIWEAILTLINSYTVYFIANDKDFYKDKKSKTILADNLFKDCQQVGGTVKIYNSMVSCLKEIRKSIPPLNYLEIIKKIDDIIKPQSNNQLVKEAGFEINELDADQLSVSAFLTEMKDKLALRFELLYYCTDIVNRGDEERTEALLIIKGSCTYEINTGNISNINKEKERMYWQEADGKKGRRGVIYASASINIGGSEPVKYHLREPIELIDSDPGLDWKKRAEKVRKDYQDIFNQYSEDEQAILDLFLNRYTERGITVFHHIADTLTRYPEFAKYGNSIQIMELFGSQEQLEKALRQLQNWLYSV